MTHVRVDRVMSQLIIGTWLFDTPSGAAIRR
jgi:hypothetical protein